MLNISTKYFGFLPNENMNIFIGDGTEYIKSKLIKKNRIK